MLKTLQKITYIIVVFILIYACARRGRPDGGPRDEQAPIMVTANPPYKSVNFNKKEIKIYFDEYIKLTKLQEQLVVSPPLKNPPIITPQGYPSKYIKIEILDTLKSNTTYTFNFGTSIQDNNENNKLEDFKYVFSTGSFIDSLQVQGSVKYAFKKDTLKNALVLLYESTKDFNDSVIYKEKPSYVGNTLNSNQFTLTNLKEGKYKVALLKQTNNTYNFNPKNDFIGFLDTIITLPKDSVISKEIIAFKEELPFKLSRPKEVTKGHIAFGYEGEVKNLQVEMLSPEASQLTNSIAKFEPQKDTLNYWFMGDIKDSVRFKVLNNKTIIDTLKVRLRKKKIDSLKVTSGIGSTLNLIDTLFLKSNNPVVAIDTTKIIFLDKDTLAVPYTTNLSNIKNKIAFNYKKAPSNSYTLQVLPEAITDIFNVKNKDTLTVKFKTKTQEDYGTIRLRLINSKKHPIIIDLLDKRENIIRRAFPKTNTLSFTHLPPNNTYTIRCIIDENNNKKWDTGNYLSKKQPEKVIYFSKEIPVIANWEYDEVFTIDK